MKFDVKMWTRIKISADDSEGNVYSTRIIESQKLVTALEVLHRKIPILTKGEFDCRSLLLWVSCDLVSALVYMYMETMNH